jgi:hypothetical protein
MKPQITYIAISPNDLNKLVADAARAKRIEDEVKGVNKATACRRWSISPDSFDRFVREGRITPFTPAGTQMTRYRLADVDKIFEPEK